MNDGMQSGLDVRGETAASGIATQNIVVKETDIPERSVGDLSYWQGDSAEIDFGPPANRARQAFAAQAVKQKDHVAAGLFAIFLGLFGMHKFYLGYNNAGFLMLAVSIIGGIVSLGLATAVVWVIAIIEGVIYLTKTQTDFDRIYVLHTREWF